MSNEIFCYSSGVVILGGNYNLEKIILKAMSCKN